VLSQLFLLDAPTHPFLIKLVHSVRLLRIEVMYKFPPLRGARQFAVRERLHIFAIYIVTHFYTVVFYVFYISYYENNINVYL